MCRVGKSFSVHLSLFLSYLSILQPLLLSISLYSLALSDTFLPVARDSHNTETLPSLP